ncbi:MAG: hypothetical protein RL033_716 [Pseudomonadota bacterium]
MGPHVVAITSDGAVLVALFGVSAFIARSHLTALAPGLIGSAVLIDLVFTSAFCHWMLGVRLGGLPPWTTVSVAAAGLAISRIILPAGVGDTGLLPLLVLVAVESATLLLMVTRVGTILGAYRAARATGAGRFCAVEAGLTALGPHLALLARWVRVELEVWAFFLFGWYLQARVPRGATAFTHYEDAGWTAIASALAVLVFGEGAVVHLWLAHSGHAAAMWLALGLHVYGFVWIVGDAMALRVKRTYLLSGQDGAEPILELQVGIRARGRFAISSIVEVRTGNWDEAGSGEQLVRVSGSANVKLLFGSPVVLRRMFGAPVETMGLLLQVDDPHRFERELTALRTTRGSTPPTAHFEKM